MRTLPIAAAVLLGTACAAQAKTIKVPGPGDAIDGTYSMQAGSGFARSQGRTVPLPPGDTSTVRVNASWDGKTLKVRSQGRVMRLKRVPGGVGKIRWKAAGDVLTKDELLAVSKYPAGKIWVWRGSARRIAGDAKLPVTVTLMRTGPGTLSGFMVGKFVRRGVLMTAVRQILLQKN